MYSTGRYQFSLPSPAGQQLGRKKHAAVIQDLTGTHTKTWPEAKRLDYAWSKVGSCAAVRDEVQLAVNTLRGFLHSWRL